MKKNFELLTLAFLFIALSPAGAIPMVGYFYGVVTSSSGGMDPVGTPISGSFGYDPSWLVNGHTSYSDPSVFFQFGGLGIYTPLLTGLSFTVDANGFPVMGSAGGAATFDLSIRPGGLVGIYTASGAISEGAQVTYTFASVPDPGRTWCLLGMSLFGVVAGRWLILNRAASSGREGGGCARINGR